MTQSIQLPPAQCNLPLAVRKMPPEDYQVKKHYWVYIRDLDADDQCDQHYLTSHEEVVMMANSQKEMLGNSYDVFVDPVTYLDFRLFEGLFYRSIQIDKFGWYMMIHPVWSLVREGEYPQMSADQIQALYGYDSVHPYMHDFMTDEMADEIGLADSRTVQDVAREYAPFTYGYTGDLDLVQGIYLAYKAGSTMPDVWLSESSFAYLESAQFIKVFDADMFAWYRVLEAEDA